MVIELQKERELRVLEAARQSGFPLPGGKAVSREEPDFEMYTENGPIGVEVTEVLPLPQNTSFRSALEEQAIVARVVAQAEEMYRSTVGALPVTVIAYFWNIEKKRGEERRLTRELVQFVLSHRPTVGRAVTFGRLEIPDGFGVISIATEDGNWWGDRRNGFTLAGLQAAFAERITDKSQRLAAYRKNLPGAPIWLLLFSGVGLPGGIESFVGMEKSSVAFDFDRVFFYSALAGRVTEIR
jgi:hypothetical protein